MMLDTDLCMAFKRTKNTASPGPLLASQGTCCTWVETSTLFGGGAFTTGQNNAYCGNTVTTQTSRNKGKCCGAVRDDCDEIPRGPTGPAFQAVLGMMASESTFYTNYLKSWKIATENGSGLTNQYQAAARAAIEGNTQITPELATHLSSGAATLAIL